MTTETHGGTLLGYNLQNGKAYHVTCKPRNATRILFYVYDAMYGNAVMCQAPNLTIACLQPHAQVCRKCGGNLSQPPQSNPQ